MKTNSDKKTCYAIGHKHKYIMYIKLYVLCNEDITIFCWAKVLPNKRKINNLLQ